MKKISGLLVILIVTAFANIEPLNIQNTNEQVKHQTNKQIENKKYARRGCCSHHRGVCGCTNGRQQCCDGTLSPSCTCNHCTPLPEQVH